MSHRFRLHNVEYNNDVQSIPKCRDHATYVYKYVWIRVNPVRFAISREKSPAQIYKKN